MAVNIMAYGFLLALGGLGVGLAVGRYVIPRQKGDATYTPPTGNTKDLEAGSCAVLLESLPAPWPDAIKKATSVAELDAVAYGLDKAGFPQHAACIRLYTKSAKPSDVPGPGTAASCDPLIDAIALAMPGAAGTMFAQTVKDALKSGTATKATLLDLAKSIRSMGAGAVGEQLATCIEANAATK